MTLPLFTLLLSVGAYLVGGIPIGYLIGLAKGVNVRKSGSGNIGAANVGRILGLRWGMVVFVLDTMKGLLPIALVGQFLAEFGASGGYAQEATYCAWLAAALCPVLGHNYSPFLGLQGGKGVATSLGVALGVYPHLTLPALLSLGLYLAVVSVTRISSAGSLCAAAAFPLLYAGLSLANGWSRQTRWPFVLFTLLAWAMVSYRHRSNIARILDGTEAKLGR